MGEARSVRGDDVRRVLRAARISAKHRAPDKAWHRGSSPAVFQSDRSTAVNVKNSPISGERDIPGPT